MRGNNKKVLKAFVENVDETGETYQRWSSNGCRVTELEYSYKRLYHFGGHYLLGYRENNTIFINGNYYSQTTSKRQGDLRQAAVEAGRAVIRFYPEGYSDDPSITNVIKVYEDNFKSSLEGLKARITKKKVPKLLVKYYSLQHLKNGLVEEIPSAIEYYVLDKEGKDLKSYINEHKEEYPLLAAWEEAKEKGCVTKDNILHYYLDVYSWEKSNQLQKAIKQIDKNGLMVFAIENAFQMGEDGKELLEIARSEAQNS